MDALHIEDMSNTFIEHSFIINNFVVMVGKQIKDSLCRVLGYGVQYQWYENNNKIVIPDVSINCNTRDRKNVSHVWLWKFYLMQQKNMTATKRWIYTRKPGFLNTGLLTGEKSR